MLAEKIKTEVRAKFRQIEYNIKKRIHTRFMVQTSNAVSKKSEARENESGCVQDEEETETSFTNGDNQLLDNMMFLCGATSVNCFLIDYKTSEMKV